MADYQKKHGDFTLFVNDRKREGKRDPDFTGTIFLDGKDYYFDAWEKESRDGTKRFISGCVGKEKIPR